MGRQLDLIASSRAIEQSWRIRPRPLPAIAFGLVLGGAFVLGTYATIASGSPLPALAAITVVPSLILAEKAIGLIEPHRQSSTSFFFLSYLVMIYLPAFIVYADQPGPYRDAYLVAVLSVLI